MLDQTTKKKFRLILSSTSGAKKNMAIDEALFSLFENESLPVFRIYDWEKSFTCGISQDFSKVFAVVNKKEYKENFAKRITGGGVLFHGHDISYSLIIPNSYMKSLTVKQSYEKICTFLLEFYKGLGLDAIYAKEDKKISLSKNEFCQIGFEEYDILINGKKLGGNAQRRTKKFIFQHGSIPLKSPIEQKEVGYSLEDFNICLKTKEAQEKLLEAFSKTFNVDFENSVLNENEKEKIDILLMDKDNYENQ